MDGLLALHSQLLLLRPGSAAVSVFFKTDGWTDPLALGFALRAAMLTDLYLSGYVEQGRQGPSAERTAQSRPGAAWTVFRDQDSTELITSRRP